MWILSKLNILEKTQKQRKMRKKGLGENNESKPTWHFFNYILAGKGV